MNSRFFHFWAYLSDFLKLSSHLLTQSPTKRAITADKKEIMYFMYVSPPFWRGSPTSYIIIQLLFYVNSEQEAHTQSREAVSKPWETRENKRRGSGENFQEPAGHNGSGEHSAGILRSSHPGAGAADTLGAGQGHKKAPSMNWQGEQPAGAAAEPWTNKILLFNMKLYE